METVSVLPEVFSTEPALPSRIRRLSQSLTETISQVKPDVVHVRHGLRAEVLEHLTRSWPVVYSAHLPVCPNGARYLHDDEAVCAARVGVRCLTSGFRAHGCGHLRDGSAVSLPAFARALRNTHRLLHTLHRCHRVIASSAWQAECLARDGVPEEKLTVVHPPIIPFNPVPCQGSSIIAFAGHLSRYKGVHHLLSASSAISDPHRLWIIGEGPERAQLEASANHLRKGRETRFWGGLRPAEARRAIASAQVVVVPSLSGETFNQVGAQAAAGGHAVVAYDAGGIRDWAERYPNASLVAPADRVALAAAIKRAMRGPRQTHEGVNHFSVERHATALLSIYEEAVREVPHRRGSSGGGRAARPVS